MKGSKLIHNWFILLYFDVENIPITVMIFFINLNAKDFAIHYEKSNSVCIEKMTCVCIYCTPPLKYKHMYAKKFEKCVHCTVQGRCKRK
jgi:hypothetical protein